MELQRLSTSYNCALYALIFSLLKVLVYMSSHNVWENVSRDLFKSLLASNIYSTETLTRVNEVTQCIDWLDLMTAT